MLQGRLGASHYREKRMSPEPKRYEDLESAIDAVVASYDDGQPIDNLESAALPNSRAVLEAMSHLEPVIYMGFFSTRPLNRDNLRHGVAEHLYTAHELLVAQIERAANYAHWIGRSPSPPAAGSGEDVVLALFAALPRIRQMLNLDVMAAFEGDPAAECLEEVVFSYPSVKALTAYRIAHELRRLGAPMLPRIISEDAHSRTGIDIHPSATIGKSLFIDHGTGVVIGETTEIGSNVKLYQGVTLGALSFALDADGNLVRGQKRHPTIEDRVVVYANATILGGGTVVGHDAVIGSSVWLTRSVAPNTTVVLEKPKLRMRSDDADQRKAEENFQI
jgi:serine O-acetyltransferase